jgi:hypothetical protein
VPGSRVPTVSISLTLNIGRETLHIATYDLADPECLAKAAAIHEFLTSLVNAWPQVICAAQIERFARRTLP